MTSLGKMLMFLDTIPVSFPDLNDNFFNDPKTFPSLKGITKDEKEGLIKKMKEVGFTPEQCILAEKAMRTKEEVTQEALDFFSTVADAEAITNAADADATNAADAADAADATTGHRESAPPSVWGNHGGRGMSAEKVKAIFNSMEKSTMANQLTRISKMTPVKTLEDKLKEVTTKISALCNENSVVGFCEKRQSKIDNLKKEQAMLNKQIADTRPTCQNCGSGVSIFNGVPNKLCSDCFKASRKTCTSCSASVSINPRTGKHNPLCSACHQASIMPSFVKAKGSSYGKKGNASRQ